MTKRLFDIVVSGLALLILAPLFAAIAGLIAWDSDGGAFFRQLRIGRHGRPFQILKFRTMRPAAEALGQLTVGEDARVTKMGRLLRKSKMDELPQLFNVFVGDMSLVGPRPEVPRFIACIPEAARGRILSVRPGITDNASIYFRNESEYLATFPDPEKAYVDVVLPKKVSYYETYAASHSLFGDIKIIAATLLAVTGVKK